MTWGEFNSRQHKDQVQKKKQRSNFKIYYRSKQYKVKNPLCSVSCAFHRQMCTTQFHQEHVFLYGFEKCSAQKGFRSPFRKE